MTDNGLQIRIYWICMLFQVHVWGVINHRGATLLAIFNGVMDKYPIHQYFRKAPPSVHPSAIPRHGHRLWMDNDPQHTSGNCDGYTGA